MAGWVGGRLVVGVTDVITLLRCYFSQVKYLRDKPRQSSVTIHAYSWFLLSLSLFLSLPPPFPSFPSLSLPLCVIVEGQLFHVLAVPAGTLVTHGGRQLGRCSLSSATGVEEMSLPALNCGRHPVDKPSEHIKSMQVTSRKLQGVWAKMAPNNKGT